MKKKIIKRSVTGFPVGIAIGYIITIISSLTWSGGVYVACAPELVSVMGSEIKAVILQAFLSGLIGAVFSASSVIWEMEHWSIIKQTGIYFLIISITMMPIAYLANWMEHTVAGILSFFGIFVLLFVIFWIVLFMVGKHNVRKMNEDLNNRR